MASLVSQLFLEKESFLDNANPWQLFMGNQEDSQPSGDF